MRFWKKKYYREVECKACEGSGKMKKVETFVDRWTGKEKSRDEYLTGCIYCNGRGSQTVLEREE